MRTDHEEGRIDASRNDGAYAPPRIELVLLAEDLEREVLFAGTQASQPPANLRFLGGRWA